MALTELEVLKHARQILLDRGWIKGDYTRYDEDEELDLRVPGACCAVGAIQEACTDNPEETLDNWEDIDDVAVVEVYVNALERLLTCARDERNARIQRQIGMDTLRDAVISWNDQTERTEDEVIEVFTCAIQKLEDGTEES